MARSKKFSLLDMARANLATAKRTLRESDDEAEFEVAAYLCSQCAETVSKYIIKTDGERPVNSHLTADYAEDIKDQRVFELIRSVSSSLDSWSNQIRYEHTKLSDRDTIEAVIKVCEKLLLIAEERTPKKLESKLPSSVVFDK